MTTKEKPTQKTDTKIILGTPEQGMATNIRRQASDVFVPPVLRSEVLQSSELTSQKIREISDAFRFIFNNDWPEFVACPPCDQQLPDGMRISAKDIFGRRESVPLDELGGVSSMPPCPHCQTPMVIFHDPETTEANIGSKLKDDGYASLLYSDQSEGPAGFTFGYGSTLEEAFKYEWKSPFVYMRNPDPAYDRDFDVLLKILNEGVPDAQFGPDTEVFIWNCVALKAERGIRGKRNFLELTRNLFNSLPPEKMSQRVVGECLRGSTAHALFKACGAVDLDGFLGVGEVNVVFQVKEMIERLNLSEDEFYSLLEKR